MCYYLFVVGNNNSSKKGKEMKLTEAQKETGNKVIEFYKYRGVAYSQWIEGDLLCIKSHQTGLIHYISMSGKEL